MKRFLLAGLIALSASLAGGWVFAHVDGMPGGSHFNHEGMAMERNMVLPHIVLGGGYETELTFMNPGTGRIVSGILHLYDQNGDPMNVAYNGDMRSEIRMVLPESGSMSIPLGNPDDGMRIAWGVFVNDDDRPDAGDNDFYMGDHLFSSIFYRRFGADAMRVAAQVGTSGMRFMSGAGMGYSMMVRSDNRNATGFALVNTSDRETTATLTLKNPDGSTFAQRGLALEPGHQVVGMIDNFFSGVEGIASFRGTMEIRADREGIVPLGLVGTDGVQTAIPMIMIPDALDREQFGFGPGMGGGIM